MAEKEEVPEPAQEPESESSEKQDAGAEEPEAETPQAVQEGPPDKESSKDARMWGMFCHLAAFGGIVVPVIGCVVGPLVVWQIKKEEFPFVDHHGKEAVNFQISVLIYAIVAGLLCFACVGFVLLPAVYIFDLIFVLIAAVKANDGERYRYPLTIRFIK
jgi:uncharacterized Tic20 family protein